MFYRVNTDRCIACGLCQLKAPELFSYDDEGISHPKHPTDSPIPKELLISFNDAYLNCPTHAIEKNAHTPF